MTDDQLFEHVISHFFAQNPQLQRGQRMNSPVGAARAGDLIKFDWSTEIQAEDVIVANSFKLPFDKDGKLGHVETSRRGWCYPYSVKFSDCAAMTVKVGDLTPTIDYHTYEVKIVPATQGMIDDARYLVVRLGFTGNIDPQPTSFA
jgi:hypothetical protein